MPERLPREGRASGGIYACEAAAMRRASLVAHLSSSSVQEPPTAVDLRHFSLRLVVQALNCTFYIAKALKTPELSQFRGFSF